MLSRRTLFTRLSAIALAPLAKWLPKEEAIIAADVPTGYWAYIPLDKKRNWTAMPSSPATSQDALNRLINQLMLKQKMQFEQQRLCRSLGIEPVPQEELG